MIPRRKGSTIIAKNKLYSNILISDYLKQFYSRFLTSYFTSYSSLIFEKYTICYKEHFTNIYLLASIHRYNTILLLYNIVIFDEEEFQFEEKREEEKSILTWIEYFIVVLHDFASLRPIVYIYIYIVSNNRVLVCIRGFIIAWLRSIEIPRSARYSKRRQKLSPIRARWSNLPKFQVKFQYRITYRYKLRNECQIYLKNLRGSTSLFFLPVHFTFLFSSSG